ncbi:hypothetical protein K443DRAFT_260674 [Laccaria amethystina LaAM-08-1]|uniref:Uncharacterized protein n=1 Tax=Laccaria amethystina LaAM-08-1 TaxID=1095629 RepID=A0A0C9X6W7_9AGAR|nr:hypothetical protein K443DRAFT_260674 [Laccaria amethystina LaAM-08-1]
MTPSIISPTKSRPIEKKVSASARDLRLGLTMTPTPLVTPTMRPATRSRTQNISAEHNVIFLLRVRRCSRCREIVKSPRSSPTEPFPASSTSPVHPATQTTAGDGSNPPGVHPTASVVHHAPYGPAALPSAPCSFDKELPGE